MIDLVGQTLGNYRIEAVLGSGAMGEVFRGVHIHLNRSNAIKVMHPQLAADPSFQRRFKQEAQAIAALTHPNIISVQDFGEDDHRLYLVMELAEAGSLRTLLQRQPEGKTCPLPLGLDLVAQAADGLAYAHQQGMIHRDIKPDNLLLHAQVPAAAEEHGDFAVKISDFGLARMTDSSDGLTASGVMMGTPAYMSPEQCQGLPLDGRCDIYALGIVLYEVAVGYPPFQTASLTEAVYKHVYTPPPPPRSQRADLAPELERIILRCLAKKPDERYATATEFAADLRGLQQTQVVEEQTPAYAKTVIDEEPTPPEPPTPILVALSQAALTVAPGQPASLSATLTQHGAGVEPVLVTVEGLPPGWVSGAGQRIELASGAPATINLGLHVPRTAASHAAAYAVTILARSLQSPAIMGSATMTLQVQPFAADSISVSPTRAFGFGGAGYTVSVRNGGNVPANYTLTATDSGQLLTYEFDQGGFHAEPGQLARVKLAVKPVSAWTGAPSATFSVQSRSTATDQSPVATAQYVHVPAAIARVPKLAYAAIVLIVIAGLLVVIHPWPRGGEGKTTAHVATPTHVVKKPASWHTFANLPTGRYGLAAVATPDGHIFVIGGNTAAKSSAYSTEVDVLAPHGTGWSQAASMTTPRSALGLAAGPDGTVYALDGVNDSGLLNSVELLAPGASSWRPFGNLNIPRYRVAAVFGPDGWIYVIGGESSGNSLNAVELYRYTASGTMTCGQQTFTGASFCRSNAPSLGTPRSGPAAVVGRDGRIYVFGGQDSNGNALASAEVFTPGANAWQPITQMPTARYRPGAVVGSDGRIYVVGGKNGNTFLNTVDIYDPASNSWSTGPSMSVGRYALAVAVGPGGAIYAIGGQGSQQAYTTVEVFE
jgi:serine/threonine protein kinase